MIASVYDAPTNIAGYDPFRDSDGYYFDPVEADRRVKFFDLAIHQYKLEQWQRDIVATLFGWKRESDHTRRYRSSLIFVPRKNGKSSFAAGLGLCCFFFDRQPRGQYYCGACDLDQADLVFSMAAGMVRNSPTLSKECKVRDSRKRIVKGDSFFRAIPADAAGAYGTEPQLFIGDELHLWKDRRLYDTMHTGTAALPQPLEIYITTAGFDFLTICGEVHTFASKVRDGQVRDATFFPVLYEAPKDADWRAEETWIKSNPNYGVSVRADYMRGECQKAIDNPAYENTFRREHLNQWTEQKTRWLKMDDWRNCKRDDTRIPDKAAVFGGLDLSSKTDITAWCIGQKVGTGYKCQWKFYIPEDRAKLIEDRDRVPYSQWIREGFVIATPGKVIDYSFVEADIIKDSLRYDLQYLGYDPWNAEGTRQRLEYEGIKCVEVRQGFASLTGPCKDIERAVISGVLDHGNNPVMDWMISNVEVQTDVNGNIRPVRPEHNAGTKKIDGVLALTMMAYVALSHDEPPSMYETPGALML